MFWDNKKLERTTLQDQLQAKHATDIYVCGLAYDVCVGKYGIFMCHSIYNDKGDLYLTELNVDDMRCAVT